MVYTADTFFDKILSSLTNINIFTEGTNYIPVLGLILVSAILISPRKLSNIKVLALPLIVGYTIIGLKVPLLFMVLAGIAFVMEILTTKGLGDTIEAMRQRVSEIVELPDRFRERKTSKAEKRISQAKRERSIKESEISGLIPFRKGTSISDVMDLKEKERIKKILKMKSKSKRDSALEKLYKRLEDKKYWEVDE